MPDRQQPPSDSGDDDLDPNRSDDIEPTGDDIEPTGEGGEPSGEAGDDPGAAFGLPPEITEVLRGLTGGAPLDAESLKALQGMGLGDIDPATVSMMAAQMKAMFSSPSEGPLNVPLATDTARRAVAAGGDRSISAHRAQQIDDAVRVAGLWLDEAVAFDGSSAPTRAWSRAEWVEATMPVWRTMVEPVASGVAGAIGQAMRQQIQQLGTEALPEGMLPADMDPAAILGQMEPMVEKMSASMFAVQLGQAVGTLAGEILSGTEVGLPLVADHGVALLPANIEAFAEGLEIDTEQVLLYLAVRESARSRLFAGVPWLAPQLLTAVQEYARDIRIDTDAIESQLQSVNPSDPEALQEALQHSLFTPQPSASQQAALSRLETHLALVEGWVDVVTERACRPHLPQVDALGEAVRRRRASGGPAEKTFGALVGLDLRPRRLRDAANLWAALEDRHGAAARDAAWGHPDVAPGAADLDDPLGYVDTVRSRGETDDVDAALDEILRGDAGDA